MKYYIISGEASGDLHGATLVKHLKSYDKNTDVRAWGGELLKDQGAKIVKHYKDLAFMGFFEVVKNIFTIIKNLNFCKKDIKEYNPDVLILIDYPGFNLRIAKWAKTKGFTVHYYICPQVWAWKENRLKQMEKSIDYLYCILPFEKKFVEDRTKIKVDYVGHPLIDEIKNFRKNIDSSFRTKNNLPLNKTLIALLPGSRKQEVQKILKIMIETSRKFPEYCFVIAAAPNLDDKLFVNRNVHVIKNSTYDLLSHSDAAFVASGTATLETALFKVPQIVCYKTSKLNYLIAKKIIKLKFISLVNLIFNKEIVKERVQDSCNSKNLANDLKKLIDNSKNKSHKNYMTNLEKLLGKGGASNKVANLIYTRTRA